MLETLIIAINLVAARRQMRVECHALNSTLEVPQKKDKSRAVAVMELLHFTNDR
jgi:hypothetical protein